MNNKAEVKKTIEIVCAVSLFLTRTKRFLKAIELSNECLVVLNNVTHSEEDHFTKSLYLKIFMVMFLVYSDMNDDTKIERCAEIAVSLSRDTGDMIAEALFSLQLAEMCKDQRRLEESEKLCERAIRIVKVIGTMENRSQSVQLSRICFQNAKKISEGKSEFREGTCHLHGN